jgi:hypothetical protein
MSMQAEREIKREFLPLVLMGALLAGACDSLLSVDPDPEPAMQTDGLEFRLRSAGSGFEGEIPYSYFNDSGSRIYLVNCNQQFDARLERKCDDDWVLGWAPVMNLCLSAPIIIEPGGVFRDTLRVYAARYGSNSAPQFQFENPEGIYRIRWEGALTSFDPDQYPFGEPLPLERRTSNRFVLKGP